MIRKAQACWSAAGVKVGLFHRFIVGMFGIEAQFIRLSHPAAFDSIVATLPNLVLRGAAAFEFYFPEMSNVDMLPLLDLLLKPSMPLLSLRPSCRQNERSPGHLLLAKHRPEASS
jgi:hypothetical protein